MTGACATQLATEQGSSGTRAVGVEYAMNGPSGSRQTGGCVRVWRVVEGSGWHSSKTGSVRRDRGVGGAACGG